MASSSNRIPVAVVGATGLAGQQFLASLADHPFFEIRKLAASSRSAGKKLADALKDDKGASKWHCTEPLSAEHAGIVVEDSAAMTTDGVRLVFSAVEADVARELEPRCAANVPVISTASAFRYEPDVPVFLPGVNWDHAALIDVQRKKRGWKGFVSPGPNCTTVGLAMTLKPLDDAFGVSRVIMTSMQALSGAGRSPGVSAMDILDNIIPYIPKEEEKVETRDLQDPREAVGRRHRAGAGGGVVHLHARQRAGGSHRVRVRRAEGEGGPGSREGRLARVRRRACRRCRPRPSTSSPSTTIRSARRFAWTATPRAACRRSSAGCATTPRSPTA